MLDWSNVFNTLMKSRMTMKPGCKHLKILMMNPELTVSSAKTINMNPSIFIYGPTIA